VEELKSRRTVFLPIETCAPLIATLPPEALAVVHMLIIISLASGLRPMEK
jgi:hypothetical protein